MAYARCEMCAGRKEIIGLGAIKKKCPECKGVGYIDNDSLVAISVKRKRRTPAEMLADKQEV